MLDHTTIDLTIKGMSAAAVILGLGWTVYMFFIFTESFPKITFTVDLVPQLKHKDCYVCQVLADIENVGNVRVEVTKMTFALHGLKDTDEIAESDRINGQMNFPTKFKEGSWLPATWESTVIETKTKQSYQYTYWVPQHFKAVVVHGRAEYGDSYHTANKLINLAAAMK